MRRSLKVRMASTVALLMLLAVTTFGSSAAPAGAHVTEDDVHLWVEHIKPRLNNTDTAINTPGNPVDWSRLKGVPAGIADGHDSLGPRPGFGLERRSTPLGLVDRVDTTKIQRRLAGACGANASIHAIAENGNVSCNPDDAAHAYHYWDDDTGEICNGSACTEGSLQLPAGSYAVFAKIIVHSVEEEPVETVCELRVAPNGNPGAAAVDRADAEGDWGNTHAIHTLPLQAVHTLGANGGARVECVDQGSESFGSWLKITAIRLSGMTLSSG